VFLCSNKYIFGLSKIKKASAHGGQRPNELAASLPKMGKGESVLLLANPRWAMANLFYFLFPHDGQGRIYFTSCFPKPGKGKSVSLLVCPRWAGADFFCVCPNRAGISFFLFLLNKTGLVLV